MLKHVPITPPASNLLTLALPAFPDNTTNRTLPGSVNKRSTASQKFKALLIEDSPVVYRVHSLLLMDIGYEVDLAENGKEAIEKSANHYDIILSDIGLPDISGVEVIAAIRMPQNINRNTPIIVMTAHADEIIKKQCLELGIEGFYIKPLSADDFRKIMQEFLSIDSEK